METGHAEQGSIAPFVALRFSAFRSYRLRFLLKHKRVYKEWDRISPDGLPRRVGIDYLKRFHSAKMVSCTVKLIFVVLGKKAL